MHRLANFTQLNTNFNDYEFFIIDSNVFKLYSDKLNFLDNKSVFQIFEPEQSKCLEVYEEAISFFLDKGIRRNSHLVVIGGGATSDLGGFVASTVLRGISWSVVPTTLLSMIDASIGGKVGINTKQGKNLIGSFHQPVSNWLNLDFLKSLSSEHYESGLGELVKYLFIDSKLSPSESIDILIPKCISLKERIVSQDFKENGVREVLNYGHTFGHGIETLTKLSHGMSVLVGIKMNILIFTPELMPFFETVLDKLKLKIPLLKMDMNNFLSSLSFDKKNAKSNEIRFIIFNKRGDYENIGIDTQELSRKLSKLNDYENFFS